MQDGVSYQQQTLVHHTSENESGLWATPIMSDGKLDYTLPAIYRRMETGRQIGLAMEVRLFPTITATANQLAPSMQSRYANPIFPTPTASDYTGAGHSAQGGKNLRTMVAENKWPTPRVCDYKGGGQQMIRKDGKSRMDQLCFNVEYQETGRLNPTWVEWLMGWPLEWTDLKPLETDKCQEWQQQHSNF
jgi:hypothetical protein